MSFYWTIAANFLQNGVFGYGAERTTQIEPLYPFFIAFARSVSGGSYTGVILLQILVNCAGVIYLYKLTHLLTGCRKTALISGLLYSFYPYFIRQSAAIIEVPLLTTLLVAASYYFVLGKGRMCGAVFGLAMLLRSAVLPIWILSIGVCSFQKQTKKAVWIFMTTALFILPLMVRNYRIDGSLLPPRSGWNLLEGNCKYADGFIPKYTLDLLDVYAVDLLEKEGPDLSKFSPERAPKVMDDFFSQKAVDYMRERPLWTVKRKILNLYYFFHPRLVPFTMMNENTRVEWIGETDFRVLNAPRRSLAAELSHSLSYGAIFIAALAGIYVRRKKISQDMILYVIVLGFAVVYSLYWPATRLRAPMDFVLMFFAAVALKAVISAGRIKG